MGRIIHYTFPNDHDPSSVKYILDPISRIKGFYFRRGHLHEVTKAASSHHYAVYFLFGEDPATLLPHLYIGQSRQGVNRIKEHMNKKSFWTYCLLFVTESNTFDATAIDYLEYHFIQQVRQCSSFLLVNSDPRERRPNIHEVYQPLYDSYISHIDFLLQAEGIHLSKPDPRVEAWHASPELPPSEPSPTPEAPVPPAPASKVYYPHSRYPESKLYIEEGRYILEAGARIRVGTSTASSQQSLIKKQHQLIAQYLEEGALTPHPEGGYLSTRPIPFSSPSGAGGFILGRNMNGWTEFRGIGSMRPREEEG